MHLPPLPAKTGKNEQKMAILSISYVFIDFFGAISNNSFCRASNQALSQIRIMLILLISRQELQEKLF